VLSALCAFVALGKGCHLDTTKGPRKLGFDWRLLLLPGTALGVCFSQPSASLPLPSQAVTSLSPKYLLLFFESATHKADEFLLIISVIYSTSS
jgi:hypothetical protein